jgi:uncharacterized alpha-E superfamily protein
MHPAKVAGFLLLDPSFPRSVTVCVKEVDELFRSLTELPEIQGRVVTPPALEALRAIADGSEIDQVLRAGLHDLLDQIQRQLINLTDTLGSTFFGHRH